MNFDLTEDQRLLRDQILVLGRRVSELLDTTDGNVFGRPPDRGLASGSRPTLEASGGHPTAWSTCVEFGFTSLPFASTVGGADADSVTVAVALEALGESVDSGSLLLSLAAHTWACTYPVSRFAPDHPVLADLVAGRAAGAFAVTEPDAGSDVSALQTTLRTVKEGGMVLRGAKWCVTNGPVADYVLVLARDVDGVAGALTAILIPTLRSGVTVGPADETWGLTGAPLGELFFEDVQVGEEDLIGVRGAGWGLLQTAMDAERTFILAGVVGRMQADLDSAVEHVRGRRQGSKRLADHQAVGHRIAEMKVRLDASRLLSYRAASEFDGPRRSSLAASIAKLYVSEAHLTSSLDLLHLLGASGYVRSDRAGRSIADAVGSRLYSGTSEVQRDLIAARLGV